jgi:hypothetical protein
MEKDGKPVTDINAWALYRGREPTRARRCWS